MMLDDVCRDDVVSRAEGVGRVFCPIPLNPATHVVAVVVLFL